MLVWLAQLLMVVFSTCAWRWSCTRTRCFMFCFRKQPRDYSDLTFWNNLQLLMKSWLSQKWRRIGTWIFIIWNKMHNRNKSNNKRSKTLRRFRFVVVVERSGTFQREVFCFDRCSLVKRTCHCDKTIERFFRLTFFAVKKFVFWKNRQESVATILFETLRYVRSLAYNFTFGKRVNKRDSLWLRNVLTSWFEKANSPDCEVHKSAVLSTMHFGGKMSCHPEFTKPTVCLKNSEIATWRM